MLSPSPSHRAPGRIRTPNRQIRSLVLYPIELRVLNVRTKIQHVKEMQAPNPENTCLSMAMEAITDT